MHTYIHTEGTDQHIRKRCANKLLDAICLISLKLGNDQSNSVKALKEGGLVTQIALNLTRLTSPCYNSTACMHHIRYKKIQTYNK